MKKFSLLLILLFCWNVYSAWGYDVKVGGIYYNLDSDNHTASVTYASRYTGDVVVPEEISVNGTKYTVTSLGDECFHGCIGLEEITMLPTTVPYAGDYTFYETPLRTIYVANDEAKALYQAASPWNKYDIVSLNIEAGVSQISGSDTAPQVTGYYDLSGRLTGKQRGVVIERYADGTSRKVLVK